MRLLGRDAEDLFSLAFGHLRAPHSGGRLFAGWSSIPYTLQGPLQRSEPGTSIQLKYMSSGFHTQHITVAWLKNNHTLPNPQTSIHLSRDTYNVSSSVLVPLQAEDVHSQVFCLVMHKLKVAFQKTINLDQYLRGKELISCCPAGVVGVWMPLSPIPSSEKWPISPLLMAKIQPNDPCLAHALLILIMQKWPLLPFLDYHSRHLSELSFLICKTESKSSQE